MVEITEHNDRLANNTNIDVTKPDAFYRDEFPDGGHHNAYRMCVSVFREQ